MNVNNMAPKKSADKGKILIGTCAFALLVVVIMLIVLRPTEKIIYPAPVEEVDDAFPSEATTPPPAAPTPPVVEPTVEAPPAPEPLPPIPAPQEAASAETVESHRAELMRGASMARSRMSAPTTSAMMMNSALMSRDTQSSRQNIGETAVMDRMMPNKSTGETVPW
jgi:type IV secretory pathway VirB10-like protein